MAKSDLEFRTDSKANHPFLILLFILKYFEPIEQLQEKLNKHLHPDSPINIFATFALSLSLNIHIYYYYVESFEGKLDQGGLRGWKRSVSAGSNTVDTNLMWLFKL